MDALPHLPIKEDARHSHQSKARGSAHRTNGQPPSPRRPGRHSLLSRHNSSLVWLFARSVPPLPPTEALQGLCLKALCSRAGLSTLETGKVPYPHLQAASQERNRHAGSWTSRDSLPSRHPPHPTSPGRGTALLSTLKCLRCSRKKTKLCVPVGVTRIQRKRSSRFLRPRSPSTSALVGHSG